MIKKSLVCSVLAAGVVCFSAVGVHAQAQAPAQDEGKSIFSYKKELGMTDPQEKDLHAAIDGFQKYFEETKGSLTAVEKSISDLITAKGDLKEIKVKIDELARIKADLTFKDIETSRNVETILKPEQIDQWKKIQSETMEALRKQMMQQQASMPVEAAGAAAPAKK
jgi:hypothetical protein